ncbi:TetR/AcrR family transcriptional regulator [Owenweeksia hongkongensis]|uniref:Transcriptional regulator n=1 Tax=Owenweeksia hongkongensis (strain DSM 17368 / CIP 108786 / JCM 12287 / NRRL B-23963 / UST20020801) TaxID=926562 RepID=G8R4Q3_OWEHD|nr:TetR/AcrR family transcriptional regulator [Owenweeksia hongkongensis]AEV33177.1 transcriptional regulator [Owenweeksia hongkongensis DSM 17368]
MEKQEREIMECALRMFNKYGIRSVTMDDVAKELGISKKTIYKYFENKADLIHKSIINKFAEIQQSLLEIHSRTTNAIDELMEVDAVVGRIMRNHNHSMQFQLQKYYPETFSEVFEGRHEMLSMMIQENIESGKRDGLYRPEASTEVISFLYCAKMETMPEEERELFDNHSMPFVMHQALEYHIRGLATPKGLEYLEQKLKNKSI